MGNPIALVGNPPPHKKCLLGLHDWDERGRCRRKGCLAVLEHPGQRTIFGYDPAIEGEVLRRESETGQTEFFRGDEPPRKNPFRLRPTLTLHPVPPFIGLNLGLHYSNNPGRGRARALGPVRQSSSTVVFNPLTEEARRYALNPAEAVGAAGGAPVQQIPGWVRSGHWMAKVARRNPPPRTSMWSDLALDLVWDTRQPTSSVFGHQPRYLARPAALISKHSFLDLYKRAYGGVTEDSASRAYERWKSTARELGLERSDAYDESHMLMGARRSGGVGGADTGWFAFDVPLALDIAWGHSGTPHPLESPMMGVESGSGYGESREMELLLASREHARGKRRQEIDRAIERTRAFYADPEAPSVPITEAEFHQRARAMRQGLDPDVVAPAALGYATERTDRRDRATRLAAVQHAIESHRAPAVFAPPSGEELETEGERWRRARAEWAVERARAIRERRPLPRPPVPPGAIARYLETPLAGYLPGARGPRSNPELARLMDPSRPRRRNRDSKWKKPPKHWDESVEKWADDPLWAEVEKKYKRFHEAAPDKVRVFAIPDGKSAETWKPLQVALHETLETPYVVPWESNKKGTVWFHEHPKESRPLKVLDVKTGITSDIGGSYLIDDWWYS